MVDVLEYLVLENHRLDEINDLNSSFRHDFDARNEVCYEQIFYV